MQRTNSAVTVSPVSRRTLLYTHCQTWEREISARYECRQAANCEGAAPVTEGGEEIGVSPHHRCRDGDCRTIGRTKSGRFCWVTVHSDVRMSGVSGRNLDPAPGRSSLILCGRADGEVAHRAARRSAAATPPRARTSKSRRHAHRRGQRPGRRMHGCPRSGPYLGGSGGVRDCLLREGMGRERPERQRDAAAAAKIALRRAAKTDVTFCMAE